MNNKNLAASINLVTIITFLALFLLSLSSIADKAQADPQDYWEQFRAASLESDYATLAKLIHFPLEVKGVSDEIPLEIYEKSDLSRIFPSLMSQTVMQHQGGGKFQHMKFEAIIKNTAKVSVAPGETEFSIEQFNFQLINGKWYLVRAYLE